MAFYVNIFLHKELLPIGYLHSMEEEESKNIAPSEMEVMQEKFFNASKITGETTNRLDEVRTYSELTPFVAGVLGVKEVYADRIVYAIDGIDYITYLADGKTFYSFGIGNMDSTIMENTYLTKRESDCFIEKKDTDNDILINRNEISVFESIYKMNDINSLDDFINYF